MVMLNNQRAKGYNEITECKGVGLFGMRHFQTHHMSKRPLLAEKTLPKWWLKCQTFHPNFFVSEKSPQLFMLFHRNLDHFRSIFVYPHVFLHIIDIHNISLYPFRSFFRSMTWLQKTRETATVEAQKLWTSAAVSGCHGCIWPLWIGTPSGIGTEDGMINDNYKVRPSDVGL